MTRTVSKIRLSDLFVVLGGFAEETSSHRGRGSRFSLCDVELLRRTYGRRPLKEIADMLGRSANNVAMKIVRLRKDEPWAWPKTRDVSRRVPEDRSRQERS